ncbi:hypothetical protein HMPREF0494_1539 [Limosilactobacillus antri DSM 16041]|uniref:Uncharacterized protein n=1 Tax=Limosilactobacillus antri DSM 16041 TaxID=525309 RepID=C8P895_9LACO|nr:hypothetical protein HMPREF0494_1539 [Limosilactobacillus antri DSM 16041]
MLLGSKLVGGDFPILILNCFLVLGKEALFASVIITKTVPLVINAVTVKKLQLQGLNSFSWMEGVEFCALLVLSKNM